MSYFNLKKFWDLSRSFDRQLQSMIIQNWPSQTGICPDWPPFLIFSRFFPASMRWFWSWLCRRVCRHSQMFFL
jgi:hypothetical protein